MKWGLLLVSVLLLSGCGEMEEVEIELGYRGEARINPFLAAERFFGEMGVPAETVSSFRAIPDPSGIILISAESVPAKGMATSLLEWASEGGHLIYLVDGGDRFELSRKMNFTSDEEIEEEEEANEENPLEDDISEIIEPFVDLEKDEKDEVLLPELEVTLVDKVPRQYSQAKWKGEIYEVEYPQVTTFFDVRIWQDRSDLVLGQRKRAALASFDYGAGRITLLGHGSLWSNRVIQEKDNARLLWDLAVQGDPEFVTIVLGTSTGLWGMIWRYGWMVVVGLGVLLVLWLWKSLPRFGPTQAADPEVSRAFTDHLETMGEFLWRENAGDLLIEPLRQQILSKCPREMRPGNDLLNERLASLSGLAPERVQSALTETQISDPSRLRALVMDLQKIDLSL